MDRRKFLAASMASSAFAVAGNSAAQAPASGLRQYYQIRRYSLLSGPQTKLTESFFADALVMCDVIWRLQIARGDLSARHELLNIDCVRALDLDRVELAIVHQEELALGNRIALRLVIGLDYLAGLSVDKLTLDLIARLSIDGAERHPR